MIMLRRIRSATMQMFARSIQIIGAAAFFSMLSPVVCLSADEPAIVNEKFTNLGPGIKMLRAAPGNTA